MPVTQLVRNGCGFTKAGPGPLLDVDAFAAYDDLAPEHPAGNGDIRPLRIEPAMARPRAYDASAGLTDSAAMHST